MIFTMLRVKFTFHFIFEFHSITNKHVSYEIEQLAHKCGPEANFGRKG